MPDVRTRVAGVLAVVTACVATSSHAALAHGVHALRVTSEYGAGYESFTGSGNVGSGSVTFTAPRIHCHRSDDQEWLLPGVYVFDDDADVRQLAGLYLECNSGSVSMTDRVCVNSFSTCSGTIDVLPGDRVVASVAEGGAGTTASVHDLTSGVLDQVVGARSTIDVDVLLGEVGPSVVSEVTKVPTHPMLAFTKAQVNGEYLSDWSPYADNLRTNQPVQEKVGPLTGDGDEFTIAFRHN